MSGPDVSAIAGRLTDAQRQAVIELSGLWEESSYLGHVTRSLGAKRLTCRLGSPHNPNRPLFQLTPLGVAVRAAILAEIERLQHG